MSQKPIIKHCRNCIYGENTIPEGYCAAMYCNVRYKFINFERLSALLCPHYSAKKDEGKKEIK